ncbi:MAG: hypothetical protein HEP71_20200 [Roseivirga sp.]|nr:hypothetical protein [Roseivirga sp.]
MRTMRHLLLKTSTRRALIRKISPTIKPAHGKFSSTTSIKSETRVIPIARANHGFQALPFSKNKATDRTVPEKSVRIIRLLSSFPQIA